MNGRIDIAGCVLNILLIPPVACDALRAAFIVSCLRGACCTR
jgi:hypothetical protein